MLPWAGQHRGHIDHVEGQQQRATPAPEETVTRREDQSDRDGTEAEPDDQGRPVHGDRRDDSGEPDDPQAVENITAQDRPEADLGMAAL